MNRCKHSVRFSSNLFTLSAIALLACAKTPADIRWDGIPDEVNTRDPLRIRATVVDAEGNPLQDKTVNFALSPRDVADITSDGVLICGKAGKVVVTMTHGEIVKTHEVNCALVERIEGPKSLSIIVGEAPVAIPATPLDANGVEVKDASVHFKSDDPEIASITPQGVEGKTTGRTNLTINAGAAELIVPVKGIEIGTIDIKEPIILSTGSSGTSLNAKVRTLDGKVVEDVVLRVTTEDPSVAIIEGDIVVPMGFGITHATVSAGRASRKVGIVVMEKLPTTQINIPDGETQSFSFAPGTYYISGQVRASDGSGYGVTAQWQGAFCNGARESQQIGMECETAAPATLILKNPTAFGLGPSAVGVLEVVKSPISFESGE